MITFVKYLFRTGLVSLQFSLCSTSAKMKVLNVAEKNDAAKTLAGFMSSNINRREGFSKFNKIYEFEHVLFGQKCDMIMTSVSGHLLGHEFVGSYRNWHSCNPLSLFDAPVVKQCLSGYTDIKRTLEKEARKCSVLIIWTDCDREGENIGFEIIEVCKAVKPNIKIYRAKFSEITFQSVKRALQNLAQPDKNVNDAVEVRQELDLRIGAAFTRFQTLRLKQVFPQSLRESLISYGSCQFPTLGFVVERFKAIQNFIPESFWKIKVIHEKNDLSVEFTWKRIRLFDELACQCFYDLCMENPIATVQSVSSKPKSRWRPLPLDTVELEKVGSRKLHINAKEIMKIAEKLYTQGFISYPRTETNIFPKEINLTNLIGLQTADPAWGEFASRIVQDGPNPRNGKKSDKAHPPIHPTKYTSNLSGHEQKVYEFVVRRFLACCSKDAEGQETIVDINIADEMFVASGLMILAKNFLEVYPYEKWNAKEIHVYRNGETFKPNIEMVAGSTSAPKPLTEADLIALMEKHGIGTDATHADHIETIKSRSYVGLENEKFFVPGQLGMGLVEGYDSMGFPMSKPNLRAELEADLVKICEGRKNPEVVLRDQLAKYKEVFEVALRQAAKIDEALSFYLQEEPCQPVSNFENNPELPEPIFKCPKCGSDMVLRRKRDGTNKFISCMLYPQCKNVLWFPNIVENVEVAENTCSQCGPTYRKLKFKFRRGVLPPYNIPGETFCIGGCDRDLLEILGIHLGTVRSDASNSAAPNITSNFSGSSSGVSSGNFSENSFRASQFSESNNQSSNTNRNSTNINSTNRNKTSTARGRAKQPAVGQRTLLDVFQPTRSPSEPTDSFMQTNVSSGQFEEANREEIVLCNCNQQAIQLSVKKEGPNKGRLFYKCGNRGQCQFFKWCDSVSTNTVQSQHNPDWDSRWNGNHNNDSSVGRTAPDYVNSYHQTSYHRTTSNAANSDTSSSSGNFTFASNSNSTYVGLNSANPTGNSVVCGCSVNALLLTVKKDGPNKGRQFYKCGNRDRNCDFFLWADSSSNELEGNRINAQPDNSRNSSVQPLRPSNSTDVTGGDITRCRCGGPLKRLTVQKDGPNKGRQFYTCPKTVEKCQFFMWADEGTNSNPTGPSSSNWRGNDQRKTTNADSRKKRKCGNCHEEGHTKRSCPNN